MCQQQSSPVSNVIGGFTVEWENYGNFTYFRTEGAWDIFQGSQQGWFSVGVNSPDSGMVRNSHPSNYSRKGERWKHKQKYVKLKRKIKIPF
jgi:hypothetical protein